MKYKILLYEYMSNAYPKNNSFVFIGHFAIDNIIRFNLSRNPSLGGSVTFGSLGLRAYTNKANIGIISNLGKFTFKETFLKQFKDKYINLEGLKWFDSPNTTFILNYLDHTRTLTLKFRSPNLDFNDFPDSYRRNHPKIIVLAPICNEISSNYVSRVVNEFPNTYIGIDLQGFIRKINEKGEVNYESNEDLLEENFKIIELIGNQLVLKGSEEEMKILTRKENYSDVMNFFDKFDNQGIYIMTLGERGSLIKRPRQPVITIPAFRPKEVIDETGAGDVYLAIFLYEFINSDHSHNSIEKAGYLASAAASYLVEKNGPNGFKNRKNIIKRVKNKNYIN